uniref:Zinc finger MYM-type protein 1-like n=1 Tax=Tanacetum cinerariifolium TaxID=118510 RepID=A0A699J8J9_TANCI|nr:zinc finger MYM-type protein 1-like [Tanacetum cinerariifolium]
MYYVHCFAHRLQLALVAASKEVIPVHQFFTKLTSVVNVICASSKRHDELQKAKSIEIEHLLELGTIKRAILFCEKHQIDMPDMEAPYKSIALFDKIIIELEIFSIDMQNNKKLKKAYTIAELCTSLVKTQKRGTYYLFDRLIRFILTLSVFTATTERAFSAMKVCKNRLRNKMSHDFLADNLMVYIEKEIAENIDSDAVIEEFKSLKGHRTEL